MPQVDLHGIQNGEMIGKPKLLSKFKNFCQVDKPRNNGSYIGLISE